MYHRPSKTKKNLIPQPKSRRYIPIGDENKENIFDKNNQNHNPSRQFGRDITISIKNNSLDKNHNNSLSKRSSIKDPNKVRRKYLTLNLVSYFYQKKPFR